MSVSVSVSASVGGVGIASVSVSVRLGELERSVLRATRCCALRVHAESRQSRAGRRGRGRGRRRATRARREQAEQSRQAWAGAGAKAAGHGGGGRGERRVEKEGCLLTNQRKVQQQFFLGRANRDTTKEKMSHDEHVQINAIVARVVRSEGVQGAGVTRGLGQRGDAAHAHAYPTDARAR